VGVYLVMHYTVYILLAITNTENSKWGDMRILYDKIAGSLSVNKCSQCFPCHALDNIDSRLLTFINLTDCVYLNN
jgi:hypothetical protein